MKEVEVAVRSAASLPTAAVGVNLMRQAFGKDGSLSGGAAVDAERQALSDLFSGAMGYFRNATGHRKVDFTPAEAARTIIFASQLLYLVETQAKAAAGKANGGAE
jgi:uncharacterized protein (TIGR02391 family)